MNWFRLYHDLPDTGPWLDLTDTQRAIYIEILCLASRRDGDDRGTICTTNLHRKLRRHSGQLLAALSALTRASLMVDIGSDPGVTFECAGWDSRQYDSDNSTVRSRKHRESKKTASKCNVAETFPQRPAQRCSNGLEKSRVDTETEERTPSACAPAREDIGQVIAHWKETWEKPHYRDSMTEQVAISNALRQGWTVDQIKACIEGYKLDPWPKRNQYSGLRYLLEDGDKIQRGIDFCGEKQPEVVDDGYEAWKADVIDAALESGEDIDYNDPPWSRKRWEERGQG